ncbi:MAG: helix-hairpin-helix domain-containing protein [Deltaproteobacteria bacterium]|nr:helix-hairpin-helix domain-containing protein [Deltaproteobacteria bacterium]MBW2200179.1 helix-hairpin-helix domain-containing protein [Deltaproteobacteria bacterium]
MKKTLSVLALCTAVLIVMSMAGSLLADDSAKININTASVDELAQLKRIGLKYAERIVEYREKNGPFQRPEEIMLVKGIGTKTWELNKEQIIVEVVKDKKG